MACARRVTISLASLKPGRPSSYLHCRMTHNNLKRNISDTLAQIAQDHDDCKRTCPNRPEEESKTHSKPPPDTTNNPVKANVQPTSATTNATKKRNKKKNQLFSINKLTTSEQSLEASIKELIGDEVYNNLIENFNHSNQTPGSQDYRQPGWKQSGWDLDDNPSSSFRHVQVLISALSSFGDGIGISPEKNWAVVVPFCVPGDIVKTKIYRHTPTHSLGDFIGVVKPGEMRNDELIRCKYFGKCSGCQFQMINYSKQLEIKRTTVQRAFRQFSGLDSASIPPVESTLESPKQYEYRTKLTPHFELPREMKSKKATGQSEDKPKVENDSYQTGPGGLAIGLAEKGRRRVVDIEECVLGTKTINEKLKTERARVQETIGSFKRGATLLLRESLVIPNDTKSLQVKIQEESKESLQGKIEERSTESVQAKMEEEESEEMPVVVPNDKSCEVKDEEESKKMGVAIPNHAKSLEGKEEEESTKICVTNHKTIVREKVLDKVFEQNAGSFFQNNPSILGPFIQYIIDDLIPKRQPDQDRYLVDAYCGSGLFSISLAHHFTKTIGIELSSDSLFYAKRNADLNNIKNASFIVGEAEAIFKDLKFPPRQTTIMIDPPRKGCSIEFLNQLKEFKPVQIIYVSCNVITQAQDIKHIKDIYRVERIRGLDFFPQTYHCESVAVLQLIDS